MHKKLASALAIGALAVPAVALAAEPSQTDQQNAAKQCKSLRTSSGGGENFRSAVDALATGDKVTLKNAYGKCVSFYAKDEAKENASAQKQAVADCKAERAAATTDEQKAAFAAKYGAKNASSAYGKCVSSHAKADKQAADEQDKNTVNAAKQCKTEWAAATTEEQKAAFQTKYKAKNRKSAFGKCVSTTAKAKNDAQQQS